MAYALKFRKQVMKAKEEEKLSYEQTAKRYKVGTATLVRWARRIIPCEKRKKGAVKIDMESLKADIEKNPDDYQYERANRFKVSQNAIHHALIRLKVSYKKNPFAIRRQTLLPEKLSKKR